MKEQIPNRVRVLTAHLAQIRMAARGARQMRALDGLDSASIWRVQCADYEEIAGRLRGLLICLMDRLPDKDLILIAEFIDANELGLALEQMADVLSEDQQPLTPDERSDMLTLVDRMHMDHRVPHALTFCPSADFAHQRPSGHGQALMLAHRLPATQSDARSAATSCMAARLAA
jgi:hypothetical protein